MYVNAVKYRGVWLAPNSKAFEMYHDKKVPKSALDKLLKESEVKEKELVERYK